MGERGGQVVHRMVEVSPKSEGGNTGRERGRERGDWGVEFRSKGDVLRVAGEREEVADYHMFG